MLITIFFMIASLILIICVPIYVKRKNKFYSLKTNEKLNVNKKDIRTIWGIDKIKDGIITNNNRHSIIIELGSIEYRLLNEEEQNNIDNNLTKLAKTFTYQTQFFSTIEKIDTSDKIDEIRNNLDKQRNQKIKDYGESIIEYLEDIMKEENLYVRKNYLIVTSDEPFRKAKVDLEDFYEDIKYSLSDIKVRAKMLSDIEIIELIYRELNKNCNEKLRNIIEKGGLDFYVHSESKT